MIKQQWKKLESKVDSLSLRERVLIFSAIAFLLVTLAKSFFLEPLLHKKESLTANIVQQQKRMQVLQAQIDASLNARKEMENSAAHSRLEQARKELAEGNAYLQGNSDRLVPPEKMVELMQEVLSQDGQLQLVSLRTLPVEPLIMGDPAKSASQGASEAKDGQDKQIYKHGMEIVVHGSYLDLLQYLAEVEKLPMQMFWGEAKMSVERYPEIDLTLTVYTLSLEKTWIQI